MDRPDRSGIAALGLIGLLGFAMLATIGISIGWGIGMLINAIF